MLLRRSWECTLLYKSINTPRDKWESITLKSFPYQKFLKFDFKNEWSRRKKRKSILIKFVYLQNWRCHYLKFDKKLLGTLSVHTVIGFIDGNTFEHEPKPSPAEPARCASVDDTPSWGKQVWLAARPNPRVVSPSKWASTKPQLVSAQCGGLTFMLAVLFK